ncbi:hypothetical protein GGR88_001319 [Sphingomonas jejuensis]|uniref:Uncharacterized protein n=1 Tax=Sphingomonas jejuensis TaxID=904715 RepID=A0ABX0XMB8_9SPHN|nr:hypothetical protein [Sphingomonas jejuensis]NJC33845.1 hypothetical protein [Sphingomonas jejuensis]
MIPELLADPDGSVSRAGAERGLIDRAAAIADCDARRRLAVDAFPKETAR